MTLEYCLRQPNTTGADDQTFSAEWITDLELMYRLKKVTFALEVQNLLDISRTQFLQNSA